MQTGSKMLEINAADSEPPPLSFSEKNCVVETMQKISYTKVNSIQIIGTNTEAKIFILFFCFFKRQAQQVKFSWRKRQTKNFTSNDTACQILAGTQNKENNL